MDAIVDGVYNATGGYDIEAMDTTEFWALVEANDLTGQAIEIRTHLIDGVQNQCVSIENDSRAHLPLENWVDLSAADLGCEIGTEYRVDAVTSDGTVIDSYTTLATA